MSFDNHQAIKSKLQKIVLKNEQVNGLDIEEETNLNLLEAQKHYTKKMKNIHLIERDFEKQNQILQHIRSNPFFMFIYFINFNLIKLKNKLKL